MANPLDVVQADISSIGNANWSWKALTPDAKIINRTCYGLIFQWLPKSLIPSWFKNSIRNADVEKACPAVKDKIVTLLANSPKFQEICDKATQKMNELIDRINKSRPQEKHLDKLDMAALIVKAKAEAEAPKPQESAQDAAKPEAPVASPNKGRRNSKGGTPEKQQAAAASASPKLPSPRASLSSPTKLKPSAPLRSPDVTKVDDPIDLTKLPSPLKSIVSPNQTIRGDAQPTPNQQNTEDAPVVPKPPRARNPIVSPDQSISTLFRSPDESKADEVPGRPGRTPYRKGRKSELQRRESQTTTTPRRSPRGHSKH